TKRAAPLPRGRTQRAKIARARASIAPVPTPTPVVGRSRISSAASDAVLPPGHAEAPADVSVIPFSQRRTLLELNSITCRWPLGDPRDADFFFCGGLAFEGLPYCAAHAALAYTPAGLRGTRGVRR